MPRWTLTVEERFHAKYHVDEATGCWLWTAAMGSKGYGRFNPDGRTRDAYRWAYEHFVGPVPPGKVLDHFVCSDRRCVNPSHLRPVTVRENSLRSDISIPAVNAAKTQCNHGHEFTPENTWISKRGQRRCRRCRADSMVRDRAKKRAAA